MRMRKLLLGLVVVAFGGGVAFGVLKHRNATVDVPDEATEPAKVTEATTLNLVGPHGDQPQKAGRRGASEREGVS